MGADDDDEESDMSSVIISTSEASQGDEAALDAVAQQLAKKDEAKAQKVDYDRYHFSVG